MKGKLCILAAGLGTRNTFYTNLHKGLLPVENKPAISHIIGNTPNDMEIVIAVGHMADQLKSYLNFVFPNRKITYVHIDPYQGPNSGPGVSLLQCKEHLQCPFIFTSVDTLLPPKVLHAPPTFDWIGVDKEQAITYACFTNDGLKRMEIPPIYIGIAGIFDYISYFRRLEESKATEVTDGFPISMMPCCFNWIDTGSDASYKLLNSSIIVPPKNDQAIFIDNHKVVKFFVNANQADGVYKRAVALKADVVKLNDHILGYEYIEGELFSNVKTREEYYTYLVLDKIMTKGVARPEGFDTLCHQMYNVKTYGRVARLLAMWDGLENIRYVNGVKIKPINFYLGNIPWKYIVETAVPSEKFHGDVQPENIIVSSSKVSFIDWRDGFAGNTEVGDMYYDFGKLYHGCLVSNQKILENKYDLVIEDDRAEISIEIKPFLGNVLTMMKEYCEEHDLDWKKIELLGALQYITIACLYDDPKYSAFLFLLGKLLLEKHEEGTEEIMELIR